MRFRPCRGKSACRDDGEVCLTCGRNLIEVEKTRLLIEAVTEHLLGQGYENPEDFTAYLSDKALKKLKSRQQAAL
ncbi:hypothetical protein JCM17960_07190 [Magnetospira thiophila]